MAVEKSNLRDCRDRVSTLRGLNLSLLISIQVADTWQHVQSHKLAADVPLNLWASGYTSPSLHDFLSNFRLTPNRNLLSGTRAGFTVTVLFDRCHRGIYARELERSFVDEIFDGVKFQFFSWFFWWLNFAVIFYSDFSVIYIHTYVCVWIWDMISFVIFK